MSIVTDPSGAVKRLLGPGLSGGRPKNSGSLKGPLRPWFPSQTVRDLPKTLGKTAEDAEKRGDKTRTLTLEPIGETAASVAEIAGFWPISGEMADEPKSGDFGDHSAQVLGKSLCASLRTRRINRGEGKFERPVPWEGLGVHETGSLVGDGRMILDAADAIQPQKFSGIQTRVSDWGVEPAASR